MSEQPGKYQRSFSGMVGAMIVLLLVVVAFVVFRDINRNEPEDPIEPVDYAAPAEYAREQVGFVVAPRELPEGWIATNVRFTQGSEPFWQLATLTDEEKFVGLRQGPLTVPEMVELHVGAEAEEAGEVLVDGEPWQSFTDVDKDLALVRRVDGITTLVVGRVPQATLEEFIATLE